MSSRKLEISREPFHANMGTIKDRSSKDITEAEEIKKKWQEYTEDLHTQKLNVLGNHDGVITHLESDILECEVRCTLGSITMNKASGGGGIPAEVFQILKGGAIKVLHSIYQQIWKPSSGPRTGKGQFSFQSKRRAMTKNAQTTVQSLISHASKEMLKILQAWLQPYMK